MWMLQLWVLFQAHPLLRVYTWLSWKRCKNVVWRWKFVFHLGVVSIPQELQVLSGITQCLADSTCLNRAGAGRGCVWYTQTHTCWGKYTTEYNAVQCTHMGQSNSWGTWDRLESIQHKSFCAAQKHMTRVERKYFNCQHVSSKSYIFSSYICDSKGLRHSHIADNEVSFVLLFVL